MFAGKTGSSFNGDAMQLRAEQVHQLYLNVPLGLTATLINSSILVFVLRQLISPHILFNWLALVYLTVGLRFLHLRRYRRDADAQSRTRYWLNRFIVLTALSGFLWGATGIILFPLDSVAHQGFLTLLLGGMAAGSAVAYAAFMNAFLVFSLPAMLPVIVRFFFIGDEIHLGIGLMTTLFAAIIIVIGKKTHDMALSSMRLRFENLALIDYLASAKEQTESLNRELMAEIAERKRAEGELKKHREKLQELVEERTRALSEANELLTKEIGERTRMAEALRVSEEHFRFLVENAMDVITVLDGRGIILYQSPSTERVMGYPPEELIGKDVFSYIHGEDLPRVLKSFQKVKENMGDSEMVELRFRHADGSWRILEAFGMSIMDEQNRIKIIINSRDNSERRKLEESLTRMQKLESLGILAGGLAHDFNNLLTSIIGNIDIALTEMNPGGRTHDMLRKAENAASRARNLTHQLLTFSKGGEPIIKEISLEPFVREAANFALRGADVQCEFDVPEELWPVQGDEGQLNQVIGNIIINADQAMPEGGMVRIECRNISHRAGGGLPLAEGDYVKISVADQGGGIPEEQRGKIFDPYFTTKPGGSGLGLAITHSVVTKHGGYIDAESNALGGATFNIYLPSASRSAKPTNTSETGIRRGSGRLLLMDDEEMILEVATELFRTLGYETVTCRNGNEAIACYAEAKKSGRPFDAVITDLTIPGGPGGKETVGELLKMDPGARVVVSSGYSNDPVMANFREYGFAAVLAKPYNIRDLSNTIYSVINGPGK